MIVPPLLAYCTAHTYYRRFLPVGEPQGIGLDGTT